MEIKLREGAMKKNGDEGDGKKITRFKKRESENKDEKRR